MATLADNLIQNLLGAGGLVGTAFAQGRQNQLGEQEGQQQLQIGQMRIAAAQRQQQQAAQYQQDTAAYSANPTPQALSSLMVKYPDQAEAIKKSYDVLDAPARVSRLSNLFGLYSAADGNRPDIAASQIDGLITAERAQGIDTSDAEHIRDGLKSSDEATRTTALTMLKALTQAQLAIAEPKFGEMIGLGKQENHFQQFGSGGIFDQRSGSIVRQPDDKEQWKIIKNGDGSESIVHVGGEEGGGQASGGGSASPGAPFDPHQFFKDFVLPHEGGYAEHDANGAPVNFGINQAANPGVDVKNLTKDQAADIFAKKYASKASTLPPALAGAYADTAYINPARADQFLKASGGDPGKFMAMRESWMAGLVAKDPGKYQPYQKAWANRNRDLRAYMAQQSGGAPTVGTKGAKVVYTSKPADPSSLMGADEVNFYAERVAGGADLPPLGMGKDAARLRQQILGKAADIAIDRGINGGQANLIKADLKANTHSLSELTKLRTFVEASERTASLNADQVLKLAPMGVGGDTPIFNRWVQAGRKNISGDPALSRFALALDTVANEYAKVMTSNTGTGGTTSDSARAEAHALLSKSDNLQQLQATIHQMKIDMANRKHALATQDGILRGNISGALPSAPAAPSGFRILGVRPK